MFLNYPRENGKAIVVQINKNGYVGHTYR